MGREKELKNLRKSILKKNQTLLVNGMGGIGKTTLAAVYVNEYFDEYDHIAWLTLGESKNSLEEAVVANVSLIANLDLKGDPPEAQLAACLNKLRNMETPNQKLLVIDNANDNLARHYNDLPKDQGWHLMVTSRQKISRFPVMELDFLNESDAMELFKKFNGNFSDEDVRAIVTGVERHTLSIELLAKSAKRNAWKMETVLSAIQKNAPAGVDAAHNNNEKIDRIKTYLTGIFDVSCMGDHEIHLLKQFVALPNEWLDDKVLTLILQKEKLDWADEFQGALENLCDKGFVMKDSVNGHRKMHPVIVEALSPRLRITGDDIALLMESVTGLLKIDQAKDNPVDKFPFISFGDSVLRGLPNETSPEISELKNYLAVVYRNLGDYEKARELLESALESDIENFGEGYSKVALRQSNLAVVYRNLGDHERARDLLKSALESDIENFGENHPSVVICQSLLGRVYGILGDHEKGRPLCQKAYDTFIDIFGEDHPHTQTAKKKLDSIIAEQMSKT